jgi:hypothetical protein
VIESGGRLVRTFSTFFSPCTTSCAQSGDGMS